MLPFLYLFGSDNAIIGQKEKIHATAGSRRRHYGRKVCSQGETEQKGQEGAGSAETGHLGVQPGDEESREQKIVFPQTKNPGSGDILSRLNLCAHPGCHLGCHVADAETFPFTCQNDRFFFGSGTLPLPRPPAIFGYFFSVIRSDTASPGKRKRFFPWVTVMISRRAYEYSGFPEKTRFLSPQ